MDICKFLAVNEKSGYEHSNACLWAYVNISLGEILRVRLRRCSVRVYFTLKEAAKLLVTRLDHFTFLPPTGESASCATSILYRKLVCFFFNSCECLGLISVVLTLCISLMTNDTEHLRICSLTFTYFV